jgi:two-component system, response regulator
MKELTVLLVEDSEDDALIVRRAFDVLTLPHKLVIAPSGEAALGQLEEGRLRPDLILLDLNLPGLSGFEVLARLRAHAAWRATPVTVLSASDRERDVTEAYSRGANHYLVKPIRFDQFVSLVRQWNDYWTRTGRLPNA